MNKTTDLSAYIIQQIELVKHIGMEKLPAFVQQCERWWITQDIMMISAFVVFVIVWAAITIKLYPSYKAREMSDGAEYLWIMFTIIGFLVLGVMGICGTYDLIQSSVAPQVWILSNLRGML